MDKEQVGYLCMSLDSIRDAILSLHHTEEWQQKCQSLTAQSRLDEIKILHLTALLREGRGMINKLAISFQRENAIIPQIIHCLVCHGFVSNSNGKPQHIAGCLKEKAQLLLPKLAEFRKETP